MAGRFSETSGIKTLLLIVTRTPESPTSGLWKPKHRQRHAVSVQYSIQQRSYFSNTKYVHREHRRRYRRRRGCWDCGFDSRWSLVVSCECQVEICVCVCVCVCLSLSVIRCNKKQLHQGFLTFFVPCSPLSLVKPTDPFSETCI